MPQDESPLAGAAANFAEAMLVDLPLLAVGRLFDREFSDELRQAGWKAYDAGIAITTELTNRFYKNPRVGRVSSRVLDDWLNMQRLASAATGAFFAALWPMVGLPTASEMQQLVEQVESLREQLPQRDSVIEPGAAAAFDEAVSSADLSHFRISPAIEALAAEVHRNVAH